MDETNARRLGAVMQGLLLGPLLFLALVELFAMAQGAGVFRYQGF